jgi:hypothetical protein
MIISIVTKPVPLCADAAGVLRVRETWVSHTACGRALVVHSPIYSDPGQVERLAGELAATVESTLKSAA